MGNGGRVWTVVCAACEGELDVHLRAVRYSGQTSRARMTRPANRSRERSERLAKFGGEGVRLR